MFRSYILTHSLKNNLFALMSLDVVESTKIRISKILDELTPPPAPTTFLEGAPNVLTEHALSKCSIDRSPNVFNFKHSSLVCNASLSFPRQKVFAPGSPSLESLKLIKQNGHGKSVLYVPDSGSILQDVLQFANSFRRFENWTKVVISWLWIPAVHARCYLDLFREGLGSLILHFCECHVDCVSVARQFEFQQNTFCTLNGLGQFHQILNRSLYWHTLKCSFENIWMRRSISSVITNFDLGVEPKTIFFPQTAHTFNRFSSWSHRRFGLVAMFLIYHQNSTTFSGDSAFSKVLIKPDLGLEVICCKSSSNIFVPVAVETFGIWDKEAKEFINRIGSRIACHGNATGSSPLEDIFYILSKRQIDK
ncbi:hypothetical protein Bhyg_02068 [Pseudolycoriella hygida]|uniref:Uncharacterized protein n=1 Tax=Pseudolycoriella hygida TaxID=35572 RepID=A0A9Q0S6C3_9DIPT|nr:hypothetical protein Bhyg_02068 [Pseudolycoriella hygida]